MAELLLVANPHRRRKARKNPHRRKRARRSNPHRAHRRRRHRNPSFRKMYRRARRRVHHFFRRRRRSNPSFRGLGGQVMPTVKAGFVGAGGALALDAVWGFASPYIPASLTSNAQIAPFVQFAVKGLLAVGVGWAGGHVLRGKGRDLAVGAMTVATHDFLKSTLQGFAPTIFGPGGTVALSGYNGLGAYLSGSAPLVGTATFPQTYLPQNTSQPGLGAYLSGASGMVDGAGTFVDDYMGGNPWDSSY